MKKCPWCEVKYSGSVLPIHIENCPKNPKNTEEKEKEDKKADKKADEKKVK